jgi:hypothetical protein
MSRQKFLFIHQNFPGQFVHVATELVRLGKEVVAVGVKGRGLPGVRYLRYAPKEGGSWRQRMLSEVGAQLPMERVHFLGGLPY